MGGWVVGVGGEGAYPDIVVTSCHVRVAMGLVAPLLRFGAWSGVRHLDGWPNWCVSEYVVLCMVSQFQLPKNHMLLSLLVQRR